MKAKTRATKRPTTIRSVGKAIQLLLRVAESETGCRANEAAADLGLPLATAHHLLTTLVGEGTLVRDGDRRYRLGPKIAALSIAYLRSSPASHHLHRVRQLAESTGETAHVSGWRDGEVVAFATLEGSHAVRVGSIPTELRGHEHARASGKMMLAHLSASSLDAYLASHALRPLTSATITREVALRAELARIRKRGISFDEEEFLEGVACIAAPILEGDTCVACLTLSIPAARFGSRRAELTRAVVAAAKAASNPGSGPRKRELHKEG